MTATETRACINGCSLYRQHLTDCTGDGCRGCLPTRARHGLLCDNCYRRLELMLTDAPIVHRWLGGNMAASTTQHLDPDGPAPSRHRTKGDESPAPLNVGILDTRQLLADRLAIWVDHHCEEVKVTGPDEHTPANDAAHLIRWLPSIACWDIVSDWMEELAETMRDAHQLAPWRPITRRIPGIPCPGENCGETNLAIYGGDTDVTCLSCRTTINERAFGLWEQIVLNREAS